eukprot:IDg2324t1
MTVTMKQANDMAMEKNSLRFSDAVDLMLLRVVRIANAHLATYGDVEENCNGSTCYVHGIARRAGVRIMRASSGVENIHREREQFLDDFIIDVDDKITEEKKQKAQEERKKKALRQSGESIRDAALKRPAQESTDDNLPKKKRKRESFQLDDGQSAQVGTSQ